MRQVILDTETTGLDPKDHRIIEVGCVELVNRRITDKHFHAYLNPDRESDDAALEVHGLTSEFLADKPRFAERVDDLIEFVKGAEIIIHNAAFDVGFLDAELQRAGRPAFRSFCPTVTDSLLKARELFPGRKNNLDALCERLGVSNSHRTLHGALLDSRLLAEVYLAMTRGQDGLMIADDADGADGAQAAMEPLAPVRVVLASDDELTAHEQVLTAIDKESKGKTLWREVAALR
jgi:DNA polymerase III subunit epsilon